MGHDQRTSGALAGRVSRRRSAGGRGRIDAVTAAALALAVPAAASVALAPAEIPYEELAKGFLTRHGLDPEQVGAQSMPDVLRASCVSVTLGGIELWIPRDSLDPKLAKQAVGNENVDLMMDFSLLGETVGATIAAQIEIARMASAGLPEDQTKDVEALIESLEALAGKKLGAPALKRLGNLAADRSVVDVTRELFGFNAKSDLLEQTNAMVRLGLLWGRSDLALTETDSFVLAPTLWQMTEWMCVSGWLLRESGGREHYWRPAITGWNRGFYDEYQFTCYQDAAGGEGDWRIGNPHSIDRVRGATVLDVVTSFTSQCVAHSGREVYDWFVKALADTTVLRVCKTYEPELIGQRAAKTTAPTEKFVPDNPGGPVAMPMQNVDQTARFQGKSAKDLEAALEIHRELGTDHKPKDSAEVIQYGVRPTVTATTGRGGRKSDEVLLFSGPQLCAVEGRISGRPQIPDESRMAVAEFELALGYTMLKTMEAHEGPSGELPKGAALGALLRSLAEKKESAPGFDATVRECFGAGLAELEEANYLAAR